MTTPVESMSVDAELLERFARFDDRDALSRLYARHAATAYRTALAVLRDPGTAEDAVQEAFLKLARSAGTYDVSRPFLPWLKMLVVRTALNLSKVGRRRSLREIAHGAVPEPKEDPMEQLSREELLARLRREVADLPEELRLPLALHYQEGLTYAEIAEALACPPGTVGTRLASARERLRGRMATAGALLVAGLSWEEALAQVGSEVLPPPALQASLQTLARSPDLHRIGAAMQVSRAFRPWAYAAGSLLLVAGVGLWMIGHQAPGGSPSLPDAPEASKPPSVSVPPGDPPAAAEECGTPPTEPVAHAPQPGTFLFGKVFCKETQAPVAGAKVLCFLFPLSRDGKGSHASKGIQATSGEDGGFRIDLDEAWDQAVRKGRFRYEFEVKANGYSEDFSRPSNQLPEMAWDESREENLSLSMGFGFKIRMCGPVGERVTSAGVELSVPYPSDLSEDEGRALSAMLDDGSNHSPFFGKISARLSSPLPKEFRGVAGPGNLVLRPDGTFEFVIIGLRRNHPFDKATLRLDSPGFLPWEVRVASLPVSGNRICVEARLDPGQAVSGLLLDKDGLPFPKATVYCWAREAGSSKPGRQSVEVDEMGRFRISGLPLGKTLRLFARERRGPPGSEQVFGRGGYMAKPVDIPAGQAEVTLRLQAGREVLVRVLDASGKPVEGAPVSAEFGNVASMNMFFLHGTTDARGCLRLEGIPSWKGLGLSARHPKKDQERRLFCRHGWWLIPPDIGEVTITLPDCGHDRHEQELQRWPGGE